MPDHIKAFPEVGGSSGEPLPESAHQAAQAEDECAVHPTPTQQRSPQTSVPAIIAAPQPDVPRPRPPHPLSYRQLSAAAGLPLNGSRQRPGSSQADPRQGDSGPRTATSGPAGASNSSGSRRAANPFDRPSLYRPPLLPPAASNDQSFEDAFTTDPDRRASSSGRWDPIPPLRPSGWRDSGSFRAAGNTPNPDDPWNWKPDPAQNNGQSPVVQSASGDSGAHPLDGRPAPDAPSPGDAEPTLTRQWGLLSRFQQARGLGPPARRATDESSGSHEVATPGPAKDNRKS